MNVAIIGLGNVSPCHIEGILSAGQNIVALCDIEKEKAMIIAEKYKLNIKIYTDYIQMLNVEKIDCVHILTPHYLHKEMIVFALKKNINVLCEKPLCMNSKELIKIKTVAEKSLAKIGICHQNRYSSSNVKIYELMRDKKITSAFANVVWHRDKAYYQSAAWRGKKMTEGGGVLINQALHTLDLIIKFCGMPESIIAHCNNDILKGIIDVEDTVNVILKYKDKSVIFFATVAANNDFPVQIMFKTENHTYIYSQNNITIDGKVQTIENEKNDIKEYWGDGHKKLIKNFYDCLINDKPFEVDFYEGSKVIKLIEAIYSSNGKELKL